MKILIVKLSAIGDVVHCLPLAAEIKARLPQAKITWLVEPPAKALLENNKAVDQVIVFNKKDLLGRLRGPETLGTGLGDIKTLLTKLSAEHFDLAIDAQGLLKSALLAFASKAPIRVGFRGAREGSSLLMSNTLDVGDYYSLSRHVVDLNIDLANFALEILAQKKNLVLLAKPERAVFPLPEPEALVRQSIQLLLAAEDRGTPGAAAASSAQPSLVPGRILADEAPPKAPFSSGKAPSILPEAPSEAPLPGTSRALTQGQGAIPGVGSPLIPLERIDCPVAVLVPGTTWVTKIWPADHWSDLGAALLQAGAGRLIICGGKSDEGLNRTIYIGIKERLARLATDPIQPTVNSGGAPENSSDIGSVGVAGSQNSSDIGSVGVAGSQNSSDIGSVSGGRLLDLTAKTDLIQLVALFQISDLVVGADTGPVHLAAATGRPLVVAVHGASPWTRNGPYGEKGRAVYKGIACQPCFSKTCAIKTIECLRELAAARVMESIVQSLKPVQDN